MDAFLKLQDERNGNFGSERTNIAKSLLFVMYSTLPATLLALLKSSYFSLVLNNSY